MFIQDGNEDRKAGFLVLANEWEAWSSISDQLKSRLADKLFDRVTEHYYDAVCQLFTGEALDELQAIMEAAGTDGDLDGLIGAVNAVILAQDAFEAARDNNASVPTTDRDVTAEMIEAGVFGPSEAMVDEFGEPHPHLVLVVAMARK